MSETFDLMPATQRMTALLQGIRDDQLTNPTPCPDYTLGDLVEHVGGMALAFAWAATKEFPDGVTGDPFGDASRLPSDWRDEFARRLERLGAVWREPSSWEGMTQAGGVHLPGEVGGIVALDELVVHGWDVARASGQDFEADAESIRGAGQFLAPLAEPGREGDRTGGFGAVVPVDQTASALDRLIGLSGREPAWTPS